MKLNSLMVTPKVLLNWATPNPNSQSGYNTQHRRPDMNQCAALA